MSLSLNHHIRSDIHRLGENGVAQLRNERVLLYKINITVQLIGEKVLKVYEIEKRWSGNGVELDKHVNIALRSDFTTSSGAENSNGLDSELFSEFGFVFRKYLESLFSPH